MEEYKPNSHRSKELQVETKVPPRESNDEVRKLEKVANGRLKKKNAVLSALTSDDASNVKQYIFMEVLIPAIKKTIADIVTDGISIILYGDTGHSGRRKGDASYVSYNRFSERRDERSRPERPDDSRTRTSRYSCSDIIFDSRADAEEVLDRLDEAIAQYGNVSIAELYDLVGITREYTDVYFGWTSLRSAEVSRVRDGYILKMPKVISLR